MKYLRSFSIICFLGLLYTSCVEKSNYPVIPAITYNSFTPFCSGAVTDSAYIRVNFTDGDGDIGYPQQETGVPNDFYVMPEIFNTTTDKFQVLSEPGVDSIILAYRIPYITPQGKNKALNGIIQINLETFFSDLPASIPGYDVNKLQFQIWIFDRAGHKSNVLTTPTVYSCGE